MAITLAAAGCGGAEVRSPAAPQATVRPAPAPKETSAAPPSTRPSTTAVATSGGEVGSTNYLCVDLATAAEPSPLPELCIAAGG